MDAPILRRDLLGVLKTHGLQQHWEALYKAGFDTCLRLALSSQLDLDASTGHACHLRFLADELYDRSALEFARLPRLRRSSPSVAAFLKPFQLEQYAASLERNGFDSLERLALLSKAHARSLPCCPEGHALELAFVANLLSLELRCDV